VTIFRTVSKVSFLGRDFDVNAQTLVTSYFNEANMTLTEKLIGSIRAEKRRDARSRIGDYQLCVLPSGIVLRNTRTGTTTILESRPARAPLNTQVRRAG
jgi:hypothetical protein